MTHPLFQGMVQEINLDLDLVVTVAVQETVQGVVLEMVQEMVLEAAQMEVPEVLAVAPHQDPLIRQVSVLWPLHRLKEAPTHLQVREDLPLDQEEVFRSYS